MTAIEVTRAAADQRTTLENLMQLYVHDFSEHWEGRPEGELDADGRFAPYPLDAWWQQASHIPLLIHRRGSLLGFALLNATSHSGQPVDRNMAEFFVVRKHRRSGAGTAAAQAIFTRYPGQWECAVARRNVAALGFWRKAVATCPVAGGIEELDVEDANWNGPVIRFLVRGAISQTAATDP